MEMIEIMNLTQNQVNQEEVKKIAHRILAGENREKAGLSIVFVGQGRMRQINRRYRGKNKSTDVLAFPESGPFPTSPGIPPSLGEILISLRDVKKNARRFGVSVEQELARVLVHGILHLVGYDHEKSEEEAEIMLEKQQNYLQSLEIKSKTAKSNIKNQISK